MHCTCLSCLLVSSNPDPLAITGLPSNAHSCPFYPSDPLLHPSQPQPPHLHRQLKQIIQTLRLRLGLHHILSPHIHAMPSDQHRARLGPLLDRPIQRVPQILLVRGILDDRDA